MESSRVEAMATVTHPLTLEEFRSRYGQQKPHFESGSERQSRRQCRHGCTPCCRESCARLYGEPDTNPVPRWSCEIDPQWEPVPDVIATLQSINDYPTEPVEIVVEILSPDDKLMYIIKKCHHYERIGTERVFVLDPVEKLAWQWNSGSLEAVTQLLLPNGAAVALDEVWRQLDEQA